MDIDFTIQNEKLLQAVEIQNEHNLDVWLTLVRETPMTPDPALDLILGLDMTWVSAFIITRSGERIAIVGRYDAENIRRMGGFTKIIPYDMNPIPDLVNALTELDPDYIGLNYSESDVAADGLSHGLWQVLNNALAETPYKHRLVSADRVIGSLRGRKTETEIQRVRAAVQSTEEIIAAVTQHLEPGQSAVELYDFVQAQMAARGLKSAWSPCPMVTPGPDASVGHAMPDAQYKTAAGQLLHMDLGVIQNGYCSDMQRTWYLKKPNENRVPDAVLEGFGFVYRAIMEAARVLQPGVRGWEVDAASRKFFTDNGIPEYQHAVGHQIGRSVHDGATVLGPRWERYGKTPEGVIEVGNIFTLELGLSVPDYGFIGLEEDVLVIEHGIEWLSTPQTELIVV